MQPIINTVGERVYPQHWDNPNSQGTLIRATELWPEGTVEEYAYLVDNNLMCEIKTENSKIKPVYVPEGLACHSAYIDCMYGDKYEKARRHLSKGMDSPDEELLAFAREYFELDVVAVRTVYYYNVSNGFDCPRIDILYKE